MQPIKTMTKTKITTRTKTIIALAFVAAFGLAAAGAFNLTRSVPTSDELTAKLDASAKGTCTFTVKGQIKVQDISLSPETMGSENVIYDLAKAQVKILSKDADDTFWTDEVEGQTGDEGRFQLRFKKNDVDSCTKGRYIMAQVKLENEDFDVQDAGIADTGFLMSPDWLVMFNYDGVANMIPNSTWAFDGSLEGIDRHKFFGPYILFTTEPADVDPDLKPYDISTSSDLTNKAGNDEAFLFVMANKTQDYLKTLGSAYEFNDKIEINYGTSIWVKDEKENSSANPITENIFINSEQFKTRMLGNVIEKLPVEIILHELGHIWHFQHDNGSIISSESASAAISEFYNNHNGHYASDYEFIAFMEGFASYFATEIINNIYAANYFNNKIYYDIYSTYEPDSLYTRELLAMGGLVLSGSIDSEEEGWDTTYILMTDISLIDNSEFGWFQLFNFLKAKNMYRYDFGTVDITDINGDLPGGETYSNGQYFDGNPSCQEKKVAEAESDCLYDENCDSTGVVTNKCLPVCDNNIYIACPVAHYEKDTEVNCDVESWDLTFKNILDVFLAHPKQGYSENIDINELTLDKFLKRLDGTTDKINGAQVGVMKEILDPTNKEQPKDIMGCKLVNDLRVSL